MATKAKALVAKWKEVVQKEEEEEEDDDESDDNQGSDYSDSNSTTHSLQIKALLYITHLLAIQCHSSAKLGKDHDLLFFFDFVFLSRS